MASPVDAVRLVTIHGAKGLEFRAVHILDMNEERFPGKQKRDEKPLPPGIEDNRDSDTAHLEERECEFFVAISRAEQHLRLYRSDRVATRSRTRSNFLDRIECDERRISTRERPVSSVALQPACTAIDALSVQDLREYEQCPLKIAYRRSLGIRSRRHESPFLRTVSVLYGVVDELPAILSKDDVANAFNQTSKDMWTQRGPVGHSLEPDYRMLANRYISSLQDIVSGFRFQHETDIMVDINGGILRVPPPLIGTDSGGQTIARFVEAGSATSKTGDYLADRMRKFAAHQAYGDDTAVEIAHVSGGEVISRNTRASTLAKARDKASEVLSDMRGGRLHPKPDRRVCIRCPYFFSCPSTGTDI